MPWCLRSARFVPTLLCRLFRRFFLRSTVPGVARRLLTFFVSPKKVSKETRPRDPGPSDFPVLRSKKWEGKKLASLRQFFLLFPFFASHHRLAPSGNCPACSPTASHYQRAAMLVLPSPQLALEQRSKRDQRSLNRRPTLAMRSEPVLKSA